ncbi:MAG TPA: hypothetical protein VK364_04835, partial [Hymenobacter sp.]|nr:hypothetical protein [Hymenobacter sp.]
LLSDYYTLFGLLYFSAGYALYFGLKLGRIQWLRWQTWGVLGVGLILSHLLSRLLKVSDVPDNAGFWWGGDLAGYLLPPLNNRWLRTPFTDALHQSAIFNTPGSVENVMFLGYVLPLVLLFSCWLLAQKGNETSLASTLPAEWRPLPWLLLLFVLLTLPEIRVFGKGIIRLPTGLLHYIPFFNNIRCPTRHVSFVALLLPLVAFVPWQAWLQKRLRIRWQLVIAAVPLLLVLLEYQPVPPPVRTLAEVPRVYKLIAQLPGNSVFSIPFGLLDGYRQLGKMSPDELFYQSRHSKALPGAYISRIPAAAFDAFGREPVLGELLRVQTHPDTIPPVLPTPAQIQTFLRTYQPAGFVIHPHYRNQPIHGYLRQILLPLGYTEELIDNYTLLWHPNSAKN